jgi:hypothetical protein
MNERVNLFRLGETETAPPPRAAEPAKPKAPVVRPTRVARTASGRVQGANALADDPNDWKEF